MTTSPPRRDQPPEWADGNYHDVLEAAPDAMMVVNRAGEIVAANLQAQKLYGYSREHLVGSVVESLIPARLRGRHRQHRENFFTNPETQAMQVLEIFAERSDASEFPVDVSLSRLTIGSETFAISAIRDATDRRRIEELKRAEAVLRETRESEKRYRRIVETTNEGVWLLDSKLHTSYLNRQMEEMLGYEPGEMVGRSVFDFYFPEDFEHKKQALKRRQQGLREQIEERLRRRDGSELWVRMAATPVFTDNGEFDGALAMVSDITERKRSEEALRESEEWLRLAIQAGKMYAYEWDVTTDVSVRSPEYVNVLGATEPPTLTHQQVMEKIHPDDRPKLVAAVARHSPNNPTVDVTYRVLLPGKSPVWVKSSGRAFFDAEGRMLRVVGIVADITDQKLAEEALRASEERLRLAQKVAGIGTFERNIRTGVNTWTAEMESMYGLPSGGFGRTRSTFENLVHPDDRAEVIKLVDEALKTGEPRSGEWRVIWPDRSVHWIAGRWQLLMDESGEPSRVVGANIDITERKRGEEALRESEARFRLAAQAGKMYAYEWDVATDVAVRSEEYANILGLTGVPRCHTRQQFLSRVHPDDRAKFIAAVADLTPENPTTQISYRVLRPDGAVIWLEKSGRAFFDAQGKMLRMIGIVADITERKLGEEALSGVSRRLIEAQEQERTRIARDLHDDFGQRLALLTIELELLQQNSPDLPAEVRSRIGELGKQTSKIATDIQSLSHELHSSKLEYVGIAAAMRGFCQEFGEQQKVEIDFKTHDLPSPFSPDISLGLFRVLQEALHNATKHSGVRHFEVSLWGAQGEIHLTVSDSGSGFNREAAKVSRGLGLISMEERLKLLDGTFSFESQPKRGTRIHACVPLTARIDSMRAVG